MIPEYERQLTVELWKEFLTCPITPEEKIKAKDEPGRRNHYWEV